MEKCRTVNSDSESSILSPSEKVKAKKYGLREMDFPDLIAYFLELEDKEDLSPKDLVDLFHFQYLNCLNLDRWFTPNYIRESSCAKKVLQIYGKKDSVDLVKILFNNYREIFNRDFSEIRWSLGILSSEKTGFLVERALTILKKSKSSNKKDILARLLAKPRKDWTFEENRLYNEILTRRD